MKWFPGSTTNIVYWYRANPKSNRKRKATVHNFSIQGEPESDVISEVYDPRNSQQRIALGTSELQLRDKERNSRLHHQSKYPGGGKVKKESNITTPGTITCVSLLHTPCYCQLWVVIFLCCEVLFIASDAFFFFLSYSELIHRCTDHSKLVMTGIHFPKYSCRLPWLLTEIIIRSPVYPNSVLHVKYTS